MVITPDDVRRVARLARVDVEPSEIADLARDLAAILDWVRLLPDITGDPPADTSVRLRPDTPRETDPAPLLEAAPDLRDGLFAVPRVLD